MRFEARDLIVKIETPEGHRILGFDCGGSGRCEGESGCPQASACRIFSGPCHITACRETATTQRELVKAEDRALVREVLREALARLDDEEDREHR
jgi:hypothetical protein